MRPFLDLVAVAVLIALCGFSPGRAELRTVAIPSPSNGREAMFAIYLPPQYDANPSEFLLSIGIKHQFVVLPGFGHHGLRYAEEGTGMRFLSSVFEKASDNE